MIPAPDSHALLRPLILPGLRLRNRVVMAPMTRERAPGGVPNDAMAAYYRRRAAGGVGLVITEGTAVDETGRFGADVPRLYGEDALAGWQRIVDAVHEEGAAIFAQLWHVGAFDPSLIGINDTLDGIATRLGPSGLAGPGRPCGRPMRGADIERTLDAYAAAAANARACGFDGIEIHGAHGYLPDQFLWRHTNQRRDRYGGRLENRTRFARDIVIACRERCGDRYPISFRFSQWKQLDYAARIANTPGDLVRLLTPLADAGVTLFHASTRRFWEPAFDDSDRTLAAWARLVTGKPVITVGSVTLGNDFKSPEGKRHAPPDETHVERLDTALARGDFDLVALGRALLANPDWVQLVAGDRLGRLRPFSRAMIDELV